MNTISGRHGMLVALVAVTGLSLLGPCVAETFSSNRAYNECVSDPSIPCTSLSLNNRSLTGTIPTEIGLLTVLTVLDLGNNDLTGTVPTEIGQLVVLQNLHLDNNPQLEGTFPAGLKLQLTALETLKMNNTNLTGIIDWEQQELRNTSTLAAGQEWTPEVDSDDDDDNLSTWENLIILFIILGLVLLLLLGLAVCTKSKKAPAETRAAPDLEKAEPGVSTPEEVQVEVDFAGIPPSLSDEKTSAPTVEEQVALEVVKMSRMTTPRAATPLATPAKAAPPPDPRLAPVVGPENGVVSMTPPPKASALVAALNAKARGVPPPEAPAATAPGMVLMRGVPDILTPKELDSVEPAVEIVAEGKNEQQPIGWRLIPNREDLKTMFATTMAAAGVSMVLGNKDDKKKKPFLKTLKK